MQRDILSYLGNCWLSYRWHHSLAVSFVLTPFQWEGGSSRPRCVWSCLIYSPGVAWIRVEKCSMLKSTHIPMMCECESLGREILPGSLLDDPAVLNTPENPRIKKSPVTHGSRVGSVPFWGSFWNADVSSWSIIWLAEQGFEAIQKAQFSLLTGPLLFLPGRMTRGVTPGTGRGRISLPHLFKSPGRAAAYWKDNAGCERAF